MAAAALPFLQRHRTTSSGGAGAERNLISGNGIHGVPGCGSGVTGNRIRGNYIGSTFNEEVFPNQFACIAVSQGSSTNAIGETMIGNFIAGKTRYGVYIGGIGTSGNNVSNNTIGSIAPPASMSSEER